MPKRKEIETEKSYQIECFKSRKIFLIQNSIYITEKTFIHVQDVVNTSVKMKIYMQEQKLL